MQRISTAMVISSILVPFIAFAALTPNYSTRKKADCPAPVNASGECTADRPCNASNKILTFYVPHKPPCGVEGCIETSRKSLNGYCDDPMTVDCVRLGECRYATCASDERNYGKYYALGSVNYRSALDMKLYTVPNVTCFVHDTGDSFKGRADKLDLATTVCPTCNDKEAQQIAMNAKVDLTGQGPTDVASAGRSPAPNFRNVPSPAGFPSPTRSASPAAPALTPASAAPSAIATAPYSTAAQLPPVSSSILGESIPSSLSTLTKPTSVAELLNALISPSSTGTTKTAQPFVIISPASAPGVRLATSAENKTRADAARLTLVPTVPGVNLSTFRTQDLSQQPVRSGFVLPQLILSQLKDILTGIVELVRQL